MQHLAFLLALAAQGEVNASGGPLTREQACYEVSSYNLDLEVDPAAREIHGTLKMFARTAGSADSSRIVLDLDQRLEVTDVRSDREVEWKHEDGKLRVSGLPERGRFFVEVDYGGKPRVAPRPPWDGGFTWATTEDGRPWIATSCQGEGADLWFPCKDHPSDKPERMELRITVPEGLVCASNGVLVDTTTAAGKSTFHWRVSNPISNYAVALNIAPYETVESSWTSVDGTEVPVVFYVLPEDLERGKERLPEFIEHMRFFEDLLGPYPFRNEKYGIAQTPHLGMEHQTIIAYGYDFQQDPRFGYDWLHHHEAAHEWWANLVTCNDWKDMWIHEGIGTYMQGLYVEREHGAKGLASWVASTNRGLRNKRPVAPLESRDSKQIYFDGTGADNDIYSKGALVMHTLRWHLGDEAFLELLRTFAYPSDAYREATDGSQVRLVDTEDFIACAEEVSGQELDWFFDVYLRQPALPELSVSQDDDQVVLEWRSPVDGAFPLAVPVRFGREGTEVDRIDLVDGRASIPMDRPFTIDPHGWLLKK